MMDEVPLPNSVDIGPGPLPSGNVAVASAPRKVARFSDSAEEEVEEAVDDPQLLTERKEELYRRLGIDLDEATELDREDQGLKILQQLKKDAISVRVRRYGFFSFIFFFNHYTIPDFYWILSCKVKLRSVHVFSFFLLSEMVLFGSCGVALRPKNSGK